jgi:uncharacterized protein
MIQIIYFLVSLLSSAIGGICGVGGGVIIKPVLDATGTMSVGDISFLSGCTVLCMSTVSVLKSKKSKGTIDYKTGTPLAVGSIFGGILGKLLFDEVKSILQNNNRLGAIQAGILILITVMTFVYGICSAKIHTKNITSPLSCALIGLTLGVVSAFLGIGGGPINLMILSFFFSMSTKKAAANSLYIIMLSQFASLCESLFNHTVPTVNPITLILMVVAGILGAMIGSHINKKITNKNVGYLFNGFMLTIIGVCIYNLIRFLKT